jgi:hypothetical protein
MKRPILWTVLFAFAAYSQRPLTHADYDGWRSITSQKLSRDGKLAAYALQPQDGDGEVVVRNLATGAEIRAPIGAKPTAAARDTVDPTTETRVAPQGPALFFASDGRFVFVAGYPKKADVRNAKKEKKKQDAMPKNGMLILDTATGAATTITNVSNFQVPEDGTGWIAYQRPGAPPAAAAPTAPAARGRAARRPEFGSEMVLRNTSDGSERKFASVIEYSLSKDAKTLLYAVSSKKEEENGVFSVEVAGAGEPKALVMGKGKYGKLAWDDKQTQAAFIAGSKLHLWARGSGESAPQTGCDTAGLELSDKSAVTFSRNGAMVFFGCAPAAKKASGEVDGEEKAVFDLWNYKDLNVQPMQKSSAERDRNRTFRAAWSMAAKKFVQLADASMADAAPSEDGRWAIGTDDRAYRPLVEYDERYTDSYLVDAHTGERKLLLKRTAARPHCRPMDCTAFISTAAIGIRFQSQRVR